MADGGASAGFGAGGCAGDCALGRENTEPAGAEAGGTVYEESNEVVLVVVVVGEPKRPRMSSTVARWVWGCAPGADGVIDEPNISARRFWFWAELPPGAELLIGVGMGSSPRRLSYVDNNQRSEQHAINQVRAYLFRKS